MNFGGMSVAGGSICSHCPIMAVAVLKAFLNWQWGEDAPVNALHTSGQGLIGKEDDRHLVAFSHVESQDHQAIAVGDISGSDDHTRGIAVAGIERETQVGLLHLCRHAGAWACTLRV